MWQEEGHQGGTCWLLLSSSVCPLCSHSSFLFYVPCLGSQLVLGPGGHGIHVRTLHTAFVSAQTDCWRPGALTLGLYSEVLGDLGALSLSCFVSITSL